MSMDNPYQAPPGGGAPQNPQLEKEIKSQAITSLVVGILSLVCCIFLAPFAVYRGNKAIKLIDQSGIGQEYRGMAMGGYIVGIVACVLFVLGLVAQILMAVLGNL